MNDSALLGLCSIAAAVGLGVLAHSLARRGAAELGIPRPAGTLVVSALAYVVDRMIEGELD